MQYKFTTLVNEQHGVIEAMLRSNNNMYAAVQKWAVDVLEKCAKRTTHAATLYRDCVQFMQGNITEAELYASRQVCYDYYNKGNVRRSIEGVCELANMLLVNKDVKEHNYYTNNDIARLVAMQCNNISLHATNAVTKFNAYCNEV